MSLLGTLPTDQGGNTMLVVLVVFNIILSVGPLILLIRRDGREEGRVKRDELTELEDDFDDKLDDLKVRVSRLESKQGEQAELLASIKTSTLHTQKMLIASTAKVDQLIKERK